MPDVQGGHTLQITIAMPVLTEALLVPPLPH